VTQYSSSKSRVLVFDSGLGGLSIVGALANAHLGIEVFYLADTALFPYGNKSDDVLLARIPDLISKGVALCDPALVIIACNTASTLALEAVRGRLDIPVIGVVPAIKPAAALTKSGTIGLLATPNTVNRAYTDKLISDFAAGVRVIRHGAVGLAGAVEAHLSGEALDLQVLKASVDGLFGQNGGEAIDVVVLACTHYPHVQRELAALAPRPVTWIDSGDAIARRAASVLAAEGSSQTSLCTAFTSGGDDGATQRGLKDWGFENVARLS
jgi:glutamate racemase